MSTTDNLFVRASRLKLRFDTPAGLLSFEDLWDLPLTSAAKKPNLDDIAKAVHAKLRAAAEVVSFVTASAVDTKDDETRLELVKLVIQTKIAERDEAAAAKKRADQRQALMQLIATKENQQLEGQTLEDLRTQLAALS